jgi:DNA-binding GntR family transcriptional regulator
MTDEAFPEDDANARVHARILEVIQSGRLQPGQRMPEPAIARALGVSRERVRRALHRLAHEGWLTLTPNRGACVPELNDFALLEVFEARRLVECAVVRLLAERPTRNTMTEIAAHLAAEREAAERRDRGRQIALSGAFHDLLFDLVGNRWLSEFFRQVKTPTVAAYALRAPLDLPKCGGPHEHAAIYEAILARDAETASLLMAGHIDEAMAHIRRFRRPEKELTIIEAFAPPVAVVDAQLSEGWTDTHQRDGAAAPFSLPPEPAGSDGSG